MVTRNVVFSAQPSASRANLAIMKRLAWVQRLQTITQAGLTYTRDPYDRQRYEQLQELTAEIAASLAKPSDEPWLELIRAEKGYATPKVDVRAVVAQNDKLLFMRESHDSLWSLPEAGLTSASPRHKSQSARCRRKPASKSKPANCSRCTTRRATLIRPNFGIATSSSCAASCAGARQARPRNPGHRLFRREQNATVVDTTRDRSSGATHVRTPGKPRAAHRFRLKQAALSLPRLSLPRPANAGVRIRTRLAASDGLGRDAAGEVVRVGAGVTATIAARAGLGKCR